MLKTADASLDLRLVVLDVYNWHKNLYVIYEGNQIMDDWADGPEKAGMAKSYLVRGDLWVKYNNRVYGLWFGRDVSSSPPEPWVKASCIGSQFDVDQKGPGEIDHCGNPMR